MCCRDVGSRSIKLVELFHVLGKIIDLEVLIDIILPDDRLEIFPSLIERNVQKTLKWIRSVAVWCVHFARKIRWGVSNSWGKQISSGQPKAYMLLQFRGAASWSYMRQQG